MKKLLCLVSAALLSLSLCSTACAEDDFDYEIETTTTITTTQAPTTMPMPTEPITEPTTTAPSGTTTPQPVEPPLVTIDRDSFKNPLRPGDDFVVTVKIRNFSQQVSLRSGTISFDPSAGLTLSEKTASKIVPAVSRNSTCSVPVHLHVSKEADTATQSLSVSYSYSYQTPEGLVSAEKSEKLMVNLDLPEQGKDASSTHGTPNIIVSKYNYGKSVSAGDTFTLELQFRNTSDALKAENIVMSVDTGAGLSITSASNTYYYKQLAAGGTLTQRIPMRASANADPTGEGIDISFRYEYVDNGTRSSANTSEKLSVPIKTPDRFSVTAPEMEPIGTQNGEMTISLPFVNKSKSTVSNVQAELIYNEDTIFCEQATQLLGNIEPGRNGTIDFFFTPMEAGTDSVKVKITYENELVEEKTVELEIPFTVEEMVMDDFGEDMPMDEMPEETSNTKRIVGIACAAVAVVALIVIPVVLKKRKKKKEDTMPVFDWSLPVNNAEENSHENH